MKRLVQSFFVFSLILSMALPVNAFSGKKPDMDRDVASDRGVASEKNESANIPKMISFDQLMKLTPEDRKTYLFGIRDMLVELSQKGDKKSEMWVDGRHFDQYQRILDMLMPTADAQWRNPERPAQPRSGAAVIPRLVRVDGIGSETWTCDSNDAEFNTSVGTCVAKYGPLRGEAVSCAAGYQRVNMKNPTWRNSIRTTFGGENLLHRYCVPNTSWNNLSVERRRQLRSSDGADSVASAFQGGGQNNPVGAEITFGAAQRIQPVDPSVVYPVRSEFTGSNGAPVCNSTDRRVKYREEVGTCAGLAGNSCPRGYTKVTINRVVDPWFGAPRVEGRQGYCVPAASWCLLPQENRSALELGNVVTSSQARAAITAITDRPAEDVPRLARDCAQRAGVQQQDQRNQNPEQERREETARGLANSTEASAATAEITAGGTRCTGVDFSGGACENREQGAALRDQNREAWYRENVNTCIYAGNVSEYRNASERNGCKPVTRAAGLSCRQGVVCNPIVFGVKQDGQAFCAVRNDGEATLECNDLATAGPSNANWLNENIGALRSEYEKLANGVNRMCARGTSRNFFCNECGVILTRLNQLQMIGQQGAGRCVVPYEQASQRGGSSQPAGTRQ